MGIIGIASGIGINLGCLPADGRSPFPSSMAAFVGS
jgi:hypothetical protein